MGRAPQRKNRLVRGLPLLFDEQELPILEKSESADFKSLRHPLWTESKAKLIREYIRLFTFVTKHGTYIDGFAAPQQRHLKEFCSANLVLQTRPPWMREFWLCDLDPKGIALLEEIKADEALPKRRIEVLPGDFNKRVYDILGAGTIKPSTATFALLDQRTFECHWSTVQAIAEHKKTHKIEIFYFLATGWLDRSIAAVSRPETAARLDKWWGRDNWRDLRKISSSERGPQLAERFKSELGYAHAFAYPIHSARRGGRIMYHMIHATDHEAASPLMLRAYRKVSGRTLDDKDSQHDLEAFLAEYRTNGLEDGDQASVRDRLRVDLAEDTALVWGFDPFVVGLEDLITQIEDSKGRDWTDLQERELRKDLRNAALRLAAAISDNQPQHGAIGHNRPPFRSDGTVPDEQAIAEIQSATKVIIEETGRLEPDPAKIAKAASRLQSLKSWAKPRLDLFSDEFAKTAGVSAGAAAVAGTGFVVATLIPPAREVLIATAQWLSMLASHS